MPLSPEAAELEAALAGQYELEREVGRGGMGVVYRARDVRLDRPVAVKILPAAMNTRPDLRERFLREARTAARLTHPGIVPVHRADEIGGQVYFVMGFVDGESLAERIRRQGTLPPAEAARLLAEVARALGYAHAHGVVHRDVKPENILIDGASGRPMVTDFGIARTATASPLTATGEVLGTVHYMSPEQVSGGRVDGRSDLYALGVVGFLALSGELPFASEVASAVLLAHAVKPAPPLASRAPHVPAALAGVIDRCLAKDPAGRFESGEALADALLAAISPDAAARERAAVVSEGEAGALWARAAELQAQSVESPGARTLVPGATPTVGAHGYRLSDVRAAAVEAGISDRHFAAALAERRNAAPAQRSDRGALQVPATEGGRVARALLGAPVEIVLERVAQGEVTADHFEFLVDRIRRWTGDIGHVSTVGRSLAWASASQQRHVHVTVSPRNGRTVIHVQEQLGPVAGGLFGGLVGGGGFGFGTAVVAGVAGALGSVPLGFELGAATVAGAYLLARTLFAGVARRRGRRLAELADELARVAEGGGAATGPAHAIHPGTTG